METNGKKVWFITGSSRGLGFEFAKAALERGDLVAATSIEPERIEILTEQYGDRVWSAYLDVTDRGQAFDIMRKAKEYFGRIDAMISNAGYGHFGAVEEFSNEEFRHQLEVNLFGSMNVIQAVLPIMREQGSGHIIQLSSIGGTIAQPLVGAYNASKWAMEGLCDALSQEVEQFGIKVTLVEPGPFKTNFNNASLVVEQPIEAYAPMTAGFFQAIDPDTFEDAKIVAGKVLRIVDAEKVPLRVLVGTGMVDVVAKVYEQKITTWEEWKKD